MQFTKLHVIADQMYLDITEVRTADGLGVELTPYLVAQQQQPDRLIRVEGTNAPQLHLHEN